MNASAKNQPDCASAVLGSPAATSSPQSLHTIRRGAQRASEAGRRRPILSESYPWNDLSISSRDCRTPTSGAIARSERRHRAQAGCRRTPSESGARRSTFCITHRTTDRNRGRSRRWNRPARRVQADPRGLPRWGAASRAARTYGLPSPPRCNRSSAFIVFDSSRSSRQCPPR